MSRKIPVTNSDRKSKLGIKYKGVRRRPWGKWVSEIRVPGTRTRLWLGSYLAQEAAAVAHDTAVFFLRGPDTLHVNSMNFPWRVEEAYKWAPLSPSSVQRIASDAGMTADAQLTEELLRIENPKEENMFSSDRVYLEEKIGRSDQGFGLYGDLSVDDMNQILHILEECC